MASATVVIMADISEVIMAVFLVNLDSLGIFPNIKSHHLGLRPNKGSLKPLWEENVGYSKTTHGFENSI